jgi:hypothetical protein
MAAAETTPASGLSTRVHLVGQVTDLALDPPSVTIRTPRGPVTVAVAPHLLGGPDHPHASWHLGERGSSRAIEACEDAAMLDRWIARAVSAASVEEVIGAAAEGD